MSTPLLVLHPLFLNFWTRCPYFLFFSHQTHNCSIISSPSPSSFFPDFLFDDDVMKKEVKLIIVCAHTASDIIVSFFSPHLCWQCPEQSLCVWTTCSLFLINYYIASKKVRSSINHFLFEPFAYICTNETEKQMHEGETEVRFKVGSN